MIIPDLDFITALLNIRWDDIEECAVSCKDDTVYYCITLKRKEEGCPYCGGRLEGHGHGREKPVRHPTLTERKSVILYRPKRYRCKDCGKTFTQENPFSFPRFRESYELLRSVMMKLGDLNYTLKMIAEELHISSTQISKYLDSYITIPKRPLPECLGIDEIHSPELSLTYHLKERYRFFSKEMSYEEAEENYDTLLREFEEADIKEYREFVSILKKWKKEILNSFLRPYEDRRLSNAFCENTNRKIRTHITVSRGIANFERFRKRVLYALNPDIFYSLSASLDTRKLRGRRKGLIGKPEYNRKEALRSYLIRLYFMSLTHAEV